MVGGRVGAAEEVRSGCQNQIHSTFATQGVPNSERLALKRMTNPGYGDFLGKVLMMGSVSWLPSIESITTN